ncbi:MAG: Fic family protein [Fibrobacterales bacterium]
MTIQCVPEKPFNDLPHIPPGEASYSNLKIWKAEADARSALAELKGMARIIPNQSILINAVVLQEAQASSEIENIITTRDKLYQGISAGSKNSDSQTKEVILYREALFAGAEMIKEKGFLRASDIDKIQSILIGNNAGIRKTPGAQLINDTTNKIVYTPPEPQYLSNMVSNVIEFFNTCDSTLINLAILHFQFESIHPYYDGNGRTGRLLNILYLMSKDFLDVPILYLSSFITRNKAEYYRLLNDVNINETWEQWILYILQGIKVVSEETTKKVQKIKITLDDMIEKIRTEKPRIYSKELVETLFENPYCKIEFITRNTGVERKAAARHLDQLTDLGLLTKTKIGKENIFINDSLMAILKS